MESDLRGIEFAPPCVRLEEVCPDVIAKLVAQFEREGLSAIAKQLPRVTVAAQLLGGVPEDFSFMAYPMPRPTAEERKELELRDEYDLEKVVDNGRIKIAVDSFGQINWFYVRGLPEMYSAIRQFMPLMQKG